MSTHQIFLENEIRESKYTNELSQIKIRNRQSSIIQSLYDPHKFEKEMIALGNPAELNTEETENILIVLRGVGLKGYPEVLTNLLSCSFIKKKIQEENAASDKPKKTGYTSIILELLKENIFFENSFRCNEIIGIVCSNNYKAILIELLKKEETQLKIKTKLYELICATANRNSIQTFEVLFEVGLSFYDTLKFRDSYLDKIIELLFELMRENSIALNSLCEKTIQALQKLTLELQAGNEKNELMEKYLQLKKQLDMALLVLKQKTTPITEIHQEAKVKIELAMSELRTWELKALNLISVQMQKHRTTLDKLFNYEEISSNELFSLIKSLFQKQIIPEVEQPSWKVHRIIEFQTSQSILRRVGAIEFLTTVPLQPPQFLFNIPDTTKQWYERLLKPVRTERDRYMHYIAPTLKMYCSYTIIESLRMDAVDENGKKIFSSKKEYRRYINNITDKDLNVSLNKAELRRCRTAFIQAGITPERLNYAQQVKKTYTNAFLPMPENAEEIEKLRMGSSGSLNSSLISFVEAIPKLESELAKSTHQNICFEAIRNLHTYQPITYTHDKLKASKLLGTVAIGAVATALIKKLYK